ncbi:MAG: AAA family ATPase [archaeon]
MSLKIDFPTLKGTHIQHSDMATENEFLKRSLINLKTEIEKYKTPPLIVCDVKKLIGDKAVIQMHNGHTFMVNIASDLQGCLKIKDRVLAEQKSLTIMEKLDELRDYHAEDFVIIEKPSLTFKEIGGLKEEQQLIKEVIELPLKRPDLFKKVGITPPKGILLHGPPGCGKTILAKAVANSANTTFIEIVASELVQKFIGEGAKLVKDIFQMAREKAPSIIFIDEIDAIASERMDIGTSGEREVQRTFMQLLAEIDGFNPLGDVKIIAATNRPDILDSAITRPGRLDRLITIGQPDSKGRHEIFKIYTKDMSLNKVKIKELVDRTKDFSGAQIQAICTEAGYSAIRDKRHEVFHDDFMLALNKVLSPNTEDAPYRHMFG